MSFGVELSGGPMTGVESSNLVSALHLVASKLLIVRLTWLYILNHT